MGSDTWQEVQLQDVAQELTVGYVGTMTSEYVDSGVPFLRSKNVEPFGIKWDDMRYIGRDFHEKLNKSSLSPGDVVIVRTGKPGAAAVIPESLLEANCSDLVIIRPSSTLDARFLVYYLNSLGSHHINSHLVGAVQQHFNVGSARTLRLKLPPLPEQKSIARILSSLDDKIELNRQMNQTLEAIARTIFKSWFVDFDPVRAKMEGRQPAGMDAATADLFPDEFEDSPLGQIPKGWKVSTIGESVKVVGGTTPSTKNPAYWEGGTIHWATPKDLSCVSSAVILDTDRKITELGLKQISSGLLPQGTLLLSSRAPIGYLAISDVPVAINQGFTAMVCNLTLPNHYILHWTRENLEVIKSRANGTTFLEISKSNFRPIELVIPQSKILHIFTMQAEALHQKIVINIKESRTLATIRDTLLPKLMSGEIRVKEAEEIVEDTI